MLLVVHVVLVEVQEDVGARCTINIKMYIYAINIPFSLSLSLSLVMTIKKKGGRRGIGGRRGEEKELTLE
jgi:hypothetical protein